ncbi:hypothetical protein [Streptomyces sp. P9-A2]|uniref:hypothetical protein n=1 Tax=Streptomyces sp. P9-A2 TaxID=3072284 RepID=UPI003FCD42CE
MFRQRDGFAELDRVPLELLGISGGIHLDTSFSDHAIRSSGDVHKQGRPLEEFAQDFEHRHGIPVERAHMAKMPYVLVALVEESAFPGKSTVVAAVTRFPFP